MAIGSLGTQILYKTKETLRESGVGRRACLHVTCPVCHNLPGSPSLRDTRTLRIGLADRCLVSEQMMNRSVKLALLVGLLILVVAAVGCGPAADRIGDSASVVGRQPSQQEATSVPDSATPSEIPVAAEDEPEQPKDDPISSSAEVQPANAGSNGLEVDQDSLDVDQNGITVGFTTDGHPFRGDPSAPIVVQEYSDYQCPFCARFVEQTLPSLEANQVADGDIVLVYYDFPLTNIHPQAAAAANAARCAGEQGARAYWSMHDALFANVDQWSNEAANDHFLEYAAEIDLDTATFETCLIEDRYSDAVDADLASGSSLGVGGTPSFFFNGQMLEGAQPLAVFNETIATVKSGGQIASAGTDSGQSPDQPVALPTPATLSDEFAGALGDPNAPVKIVEFTDYQCPYCSRHSSDVLPEVTSQLIETGRVYYVLKDFPLEQLHPSARLAAAAARCAGEQEAYWEMHEALFVGQSEWASEEAQPAEIFAGYADELGLDTEAFGDCVDSGRYNQAIDENIREGLSLGVNGTPAFFVDGFLLPGARPYQHFEIATTLAEEGRLAEAFAPQPEQQPQPTGPQDIPIGDAYTLGDPEAPVTIVEYTDFQCPFCRRHFEETFSQIVENYVDTGTVRYVFKDFPLTSIHPQAREAAQAARCAGDQAAFLGMHDLLFERQDAWSNRTPTDIFIGYAEELGLDEATFDECLTSEKYAEAVDADLQEGAALGITGTPAFFLNGYPLSGAQPYSVFVQAIDSLLAQESGQ